MVVISNTEFFNNQISTGTKKARILWREWAFDVHTNQQYANVSMQSHYSNTSTSRKPFKGLEGCKVV
ncbi:hypothetical protein HMPREF0023_2097 [Acinetobacter sp. ATCC 27244]|jgi:hypothetical protein|nr:hypothetical protein HMPREF0023_2097 [Acinetobacter sp. ATCC 27244]